MKTVLFSAQNVLGKIFGRASPLSDKRFRVTAKLEKMREFSGPSARFTRRSAEIYLIFSNFASGF